MHQLQEAIFVTRTVNVWLWKNSLILDYMAEVGTSNWYRWKKLPLCCV